MVTSALTLDDRQTILRFVASFLWADLELDEAETRFFEALAIELMVEPAPDLMARPPLPEDVDPNTISPRIARLLRDIALRAIAADGRVDRHEIALFDLLDDMVEGIRLADIAPEAAPS